LKKYEECKKQLTLYKKVSNILEQKKSVFSEINDKLNSHNCSNKIVEEELLKKRIELEYAEKLVEEFSTKECEKGILELIVQVLDKNGLIDNILSTNVAPRLESDVNQLLEHMADFKIRISYLKGHFKIDKIKDGRVINIDTLSGCERFMMNICFKIALDRYNNYVKPQFIVIDEVFNCCDDDNIDKLPSLFNYIKQHYKFAIIVSHDDRIKKMYDVCADVVKNDDGSHFIFE
jgi:DNA repair exonuclease SbcCD ATPase subunit